MKMSLVHFRVLKERVEALDTEERRQQYRDGDFPRADKVKDLEVRYRWDLFWKATDGGRARIWSGGDYLDAHVDTALRKIVPPLNLMKWLGE